MEKRGGKLGSVNSGLVLALSLISHASLAKSDLFGHLFFIWKEMVGGHYSMMFYSLFKCHYKEFWSL